MTDTNSIYNQLGVSDQVLRFGQEVLEGRRHAEKPGERHPFQPLHRLRI